MIKKISWKLSRRNTRIVGWLLFVLFFFTVGLPLLLFYYLFDQQQVKDMIVSQVNNKDYSVKIDGTIEPRSWHGLSLFIADLTVLDKHSNKIIHVNTANCQLSWLDLIVGHYRIRRIALNGLTVFQNNLDTNYADLINYDNLSHSEFKDLKHLTISNFTIENANGDALIKDSNLSASDLDSETPSVDLGLDLAGNDSQLSLKSKLQKTTSNTLDLSNLDINFKSHDYNLTVQSGGHYDFHTQELWLENAKGRVSIPSYQGSLNVNTALLSFNGLMVNDLQATLNSTQSLTGKAITINAKDLKTADFSSYVASSLVGELDTQDANNVFNLRVNVNNPKLDDKFTAQNQSCQTSYKILFKQSGKSSVGTFKGSCDFLGSQNMLKFNLSGLLDKSPASFKANYDYSESVPLLNVVGNIDKFDSEHFVATKDMDALPLYYDKSALPFKWLDWVNASVEIKAHQLNIAHMTLDNLKTKFTVKDKTLNISNIQADTYDGKLSGTMQISKLNESYNIVLNSYANSINLQKLLNKLFNVSAITGVANVAVDTTINGATSYQDIYNNLNGNIKLNVNNGGFSGIDFSLFLSPENLAAFSSKNQVITNFTELQANFGFVNGVSTLGALSFSSPTISADGSGKVDFVNSQLNYNLIVKSILPYNAQNIKSVSIPIAISGELFSPKIYIKNMTLNSVVPSKHHNKR